jgi:hypothetical protein
MSMKDHYTFFSSPAFNMHQAINCGESDSWPAVTSARAESRNHKRRFTRSYSVNV